MSERQQVILPYRPRPLQLTLHQGMDSHRFVVAVCHRRFGKSVCGINQLIKKALTLKRERPRFAYIAPTFRQAKQIAFDYLQHYSRPIPGVQVNQSELRVDYPNGGQVRLYGADNPDSLRGVYFDGVVVDEYGLMQSDLFTTVLRPALADREGWAVFFGTPNGKNQFYEIVQKAKDDPAWFLAIYKASETGVIPESELTASRKDMTLDEYRQEFECSFEAAVRGAIYSKELEQARADGRVTRVPHEPLIPVDTAWDLGVGDATSIWFTQTLKTGEVRVMDYYEASGEGLPFYAQMLKEKRYNYGRHVAPHDIQVTELGSGVSRIEAALKLGIKFEIAKNLGIEEGIHAGRMLLPKCWFDEQKCRVGLEGLQHYRRDYNFKLNEFKATPVHDFASHPADAWRYFAVSHRAPIEKKPSGYSNYRAPTGPGGWLA